MPIHNPSQVPEVQATDLQAGDGNETVLDVREADEWQAGRIPGAMWIPLHDLEQARFQVPFNRRVVCVCRSGGRSARAAETMIEWGFDAVNLAGGMRAWAAAGLPVVRDGDEPGTVI